MQWLCAGEQGALRRRVRVCSGCEQGALRRREQVSDDVFEADVNALQHDMA